MAHVAMNRYAKAIVERLEKDVFIDKICNTFFEGDVKAGAIQFPVRDAVATAEYNKTSIGSNAVTYGSTAYIHALAKEFFVNEYIDGYEANAVPDNIVADRLMSGAEQLTLSIDGLGLKTLVNGIEGYDMGGTAFASDDPRYGKTGLILTVGTAEATYSGVAASWTETVENIEKVVLGARTYLTKKHVKKADMYTLIDPAYTNLLIQSTKFVKASDLGQTIVTNGMIGTLLGMPVYECPDIPADKNSKTVKLVVGSKKHLGVGADWKVEPKIVDGDFDANVVGGSFLKGRYAGGFAMLNPEAFVIVHGA